MKARLLIDLELGVAGAYRPTDDELVEIVGRALEAYLPKSLALARRNAPRLLRASGAPTPETRVTFRRWRVGVAPADLPEAPEAAGEEPPPEGEANGLVDG